MQREKGGQIFKRQARMVEAALEGLTSRRPLGGE